MQWEDEEEELRSRRRKVQHQFKRLNEKKKKGFGEWGVFYLK